MRVFEIDEARRSIQICHDAERDHGKEGCSGVKGWSGAGGVSDGQQAILSPIHAPGAKNNNVGATHR
jgi:hypothetical protein